MSKEAIVCRRTAQSYTCIRVAVGPRYTLFIPMDTLDVEKTHNETFRAEWEEYPVYPVARAAEYYLNTATQYRVMSAKARGHLEQILANPAFSYNPDQIMKEETKMAKLTPATKPSLKAAVIAAKVPSKVAAPAKASAPAKATKVAPAAKAAKATAPAKVVAKAPAAKKPADTVTYKVVESEKPRKGETATYVEEAKKLKTFTRAKLFDVMVSKGKDPAAAKIKIADMVYFGVIEAA